MSETVGTDSTVREAYGFACLSCGYAWEQTYEIVHHIDGQGHPFVTYTADGERVPSPLTRPTCLNCGGHRIRIMPPARVEDVRSSWVTDRGERGVRRAHHWSLLHFLHIRHRGGDADRT